MKKSFVYLLLTIFCCGSYAAEYSYNSSQISELKSKLNGELSAGDIVFIEDGTYTDFQIVFSGNGTAAQTISLKARNAGKVILTGKLSLKISGNYLLVDGLVLKDGMAANSDIIEFRTSSTTFANNCRLTNVVIDNCNNPDEAYLTSVNLSERWIMLYGKNNRVDHCYFRNKINSGVLMMVNLDKEESRENNHSIDHNFFGYRPLFAPGNNAEIIRLGDSKTSQLSSKTKIENNFFYKCDGEVEIISIKSCDNLISENVFYESQGAVVCRHGHRNTIESNAFLGNNISNCGGVRIINQGHKVYNNFFQDLQGTGSRSALCVMMGVFEMPTSETNTNKEPLNAYHRVKEVEISYNTFVNCRNIDLGTETNYTYPSDNPFYPSAKVQGTLKPECTIARNVVYNPQETVLNIVKLNASDISYSNNIYKLKKPLTISGFESRELSYALTSTELGKGIYTLTNTDASILNAFDLSDKDFDYVTADISEKQRSAEKSMGAQQHENVKLPFSTISPRKCGTLWYQAQLNDIATIESKTDFWENNLNSIKAEKKEQSIRIRKTGNKTFEVSSDKLISDIYIYSSLGYIVTHNKIYDHLFYIDCQHLTSGIYIFRIKNSDNSTFSTKAIV